MYCQLRVTAADIDRLVIILALEVVPWEGDKIGSPSNLEQATVSAAAANGGGGGGAAPQQRQQQPAAGRTGSTGGQAAGKSGKDMGPIFPIEGLSPYQNKSASSHAQNLQR